MHFGTAPFADPNRTKFTTSIRQVAVERDKRHQAHDARGGAREKEGRK